MNNELLSFVKRALEKNAGKESIRKTLLEAGCGPRS